MASIADSLTYTFVSISDLFRKITQIDSKIGSSSGASVSQTLDTIENGVDANSTKISNVQNTLDNQQNGLPAIKRGIEGINLDLTPVTDRLDSGVYGLSRIRSILDLIKGMLGSYTEGTPTVMDKLNLIIESVTLTESDAEEDWNNA